ncbi:MAG: hypothetical protein SFW67_30895 [Myxococcaceae bacterium]|nr:hypothetical protein [Myxococcaceae bacterium]
MTMSRCVSAAVFCAASLAFAQADAPPPLPVRDAPVAAVPPPVAPEEPVYKPGFRAGGSAGLGAFLPSPAMISFHLFDLHAGAQITPMFGAYARLGYSASLGLSVSTNMGMVSGGVSGAGFWLIGANAELGLGDHFFVAAGPQVGLGGWLRVGGTVSTTGGGVTALSASGAMPGLNLKVGVGLGQPNRLTKRRGQFTIALDVSMLYATRVVDGSLMAMGGENPGAAIAVNFSEALAIAPTLHLGYEFR